MISVWDIEKPPTSTQVTESASDESADKEIPPPLDEEALSAEEELLFTVPFE